MVNKQEVVNILTNFSKFEESREALIRGTAKLEQMNWSNIFGMLYCGSCESFKDLGNNLFCVSVMISLTAS